VGRLDHVRCGLTDLADEETKMNPVTNAPQQDGETYDTSVEEHRVRRVPVRAFVLTGVAVIALAGVSVAGSRYWTVGRFQVSTDDAYVKADTTVIAPKVAGYVRDVLVTDNQQVTIGQVVARIDDRDLTAALDQAKANEQAAAASVQNVDAQIVAQGSAIRESDAAVLAGSATLALAKRNEVRRQKMAQTGYGSTEQADSATTDSRQQSAGLERMQAAALGSRQQVEVLRSQRALAVAQLARAGAERRQAELNLSYTNLIAPTSGTVGARSVRKGQYVQAGNQLLVIVPTQQVYVVANFKETQLGHVFAGQIATIHVDSFPDEEMHGRVDTLAPASGMEFSLLPSDNATGNFTKIVQRVPVKIVFQIPRSLVGRLRPGMSVTASIDTQSRGTGASLAPGAN
jgi:membrane fusion protein (multidrug efflux system)